MRRRHASRGASHRDRRLRSSPSIVVPVSSRASRSPFVTHRSPLLGGSIVREIRRYGKCAIHPSSERTREGTTTRASERRRRRRGTILKEIFLASSRARVESYAPHLTVGPGARLDRATASGGGRAHRARRDLRGGLLREHLLSVSRGRARAFVFHARRGASGCVDARAREVARERDRSIDRSIRSVPDETECAWRSINECRASD